MKNINGKWEEILESRSTECFCPWLWAKWQYRPLKKHSKYWSSFGKLLGCRTKELGAVYQALEEHCELSQRKQVSRDIYLWGHWRGWRCTVLPGEPWPGGANGAKSWRTMTTPGGRQQRRGPGVPAWTLQALAVLPLRGASSSLPTSPGIGMLTLAYCIPVQKERLTHLLVPRKCFHVVRPSPPLPTWLWFWLAGVLVAGLWLLRRAECVALAEGLGSMMCRWSQIYLNWL